ncbi:hypothetical protein C4568_03955 [Candidatus Parcubacteria bacterium]|nr:MAG: hypothetical protein C4568_03955 [Candidatus Parcubacteria bacterium]
MALSAKLNAAGWEGSTDPRILRRDYFAGDARMRETLEEEGDRTIYFYAKGSREWVDQSFIDPATFT